MSGNFLKLFIYSCPKENGFKVETKKGLLGSNDEFAVSATSEDLCCGDFSNQPAPF
jgi:hypothetical protein